MAPPWGHIIYIGLYMEHINSLVWNHKAYSLYLACNIFENVIPATHETSTSWHIIHTTIFQFTNEKG